MFILTKHKFSSSLKKKQQPNNPYNNNCVTFNQVHSDAFVSYKHKTSSKSLMCLNFTKVSLPRMMYEYDV